MLCYAMRVREVVRLTISVRIVAELCCKYTTLIGVFYSNTACLGLAHSMKANRISLVALGLGVALLGATLVYADVYTVTTQDCREIVTHVPADDVTYMPGVDVNGNAVAPADLGGGYGITAPE